MANSSHKHTHDEHDHHAHTHEGHYHQHSEDHSVWRQYIPVLISLGMLMIGIVLDYYVKPDFFKQYIRLVWYAVAYLIVGLPVIKQAYKGIIRKDFFTEF